MNKIPSAKNIKILLVDDSMTMRKIQRTQLEMLGITNLCEAKDGAEGLAKLEENWPVDIVLLDWNMPHMDGMTLLKDIRKQEKYAGCKIVMCTSEAEKHKVIEALQAGATNYIVKPFTPEVLKEKLGLEYL